MPRYLLLCTFFYITITTVLVEGAVDCPGSYPNGNTMTYSNGAMNYPNGNTFRYSNGAMNYPNGNTLRYENGALNYQNGNTLKYSNGALNYPNGNTLRYSNGNLNEPNGNTNTSGSVGLSTPFDKATMRIRVRTESETYTFILPYGDDIVEVTLDGAGNVSCAVEDTDDPTTEFRVTGSLGSAYVKVNPGQNIKAVKEAMQKALDGE